MTTNHHSEANYENTLIELFQELRYAYECGYDVERDYRNPYYEEDLRDALRRQNPMLSDEVLNEAFRLVTHVNEGTLEQRNETLW
jgi:type I restriction enzyme R subunit